MSKSTKPSYHSYPITAPRFWHGLRFGDYVKLLARNRFAIHPARWFPAFTISYFSVLNSLMAQLQKILYRSKINAHPLSEPPLFIVGHWRSGTTFLHDLISLDQQFTFPSTLQCFLPNQCLITGKIFRKFDKYLIPKKRPQDNVATSFAKPQEDEFAIFNLGHHSPYLRMAFPNGPLVDDDYLTLENLHESQIRAWQEILQYFVKLVSFQDPGKPVVLKSPPHLGRIKYLAEAFPGARFIHITRSPYELFPSTVRLWQSLDYIQGFNRPRYELNWLHEYILSTMETLYQGFERQRLEVEENRIVDVRYEDLIQDPAGLIRRIYEQLQLGDFQSQMAKPLQKYLDTQKNYKTNKHQLTPEIHDLITARCLPLLEKYGYQSE
ncbi:MAG: sulfotransferase [Planctomycetota bacterium]|nr:sulfotransferase [Planctomycetota bacterium]